MYTPSHSTGRRDRTASVNTGFRRFEYWMEIATGHCFVIIDKTTKRITHSRILSQVAGSVQYKYVACFRSLGVLSFWFRWMFVLQMYGLWYTPSLSQAGDDVKSPHAVPSPKIRLQTPPTIRRVRGPSFGGSISGPYRPYYWCLLITQLFARNRTRDALKKIK